MDRVTPVRACRLWTARRRWEWPDHHQAAIDAHWERVRPERPLYFDGEIFVLGPWGIVDGVLEGELLATRFRGYIYWRAQGFPAAGATDGFGSALIRSAEGHVILGRQRAGNVNGGLAYPPGGFIDANDVGGDGRVDIDGSVRREIAEETGLGAAELVREAGYVVVETGALAAIVCPFWSPLSSGEVAALIGRHIARDPNPELSEAVVIRGPGFAREEVPAYARVLLDWLFTPTPGTLGA